jgi:alpha-L-glutamate ligase-like protein
MRRRGIMGLNERNADFILPYNPRKNYPNVDNKLVTKALAISAGILVPDLYGVVEIIHEIGGLDQLLSQHEDFVIKPAHGAGGEGVLIVSGRQGERYRKSNGEVIDHSDVGHHVSNILGGLYSLGGLPDKALIEYRVRFDPIFDSISFQGVPDIRVLVFKSIPVLAMMRLPTRLSDGKANLHQGAIGVGIDLSTGLTHSGVWHEKTITEHPDTGSTLFGRMIPYWDEILAMTARCHDFAGLGFIGVDIVLDRDLGPMMLEINARPGLGIQLANNVGLLPRLRYVEGLDHIPQGVYERVQLTKRLATNWL